MFNDIFSATAAAAKVFHRYGNDPSYMTYRAIVAWYRNYPEEGCGEIVDNMLYERELTLLDRVYPLDELFW